MPDLGARAVFLDREGVLVIPDFRDGRSFAPRHLEDLHVYDQALDCTRRLKASGFKLVVVTNQPDVGNGLVERGVIEAMHTKLLQQLPLDHIEVCLHGQNDGCDCRKPKPGMLLNAARRLSLDCRRSFMIGDRRSDVEAGLAAGCRTLFIDHGYREPPPERADFVVASLSEATDIILAMD